MLTETAPVAPPADRPALDPADAPQPTPPRERLLLELGAAGSLLFGAVMMLGFGAAWLLYFYPATDLAFGGAAVCAAFALAGLIQMVREIARAAYWRRRAM